MSPDCPHRFRNDGMGPPDLWESISDRLLPTQLLKTDFSLRNWSGRLCIGPGGCARAKDMLHMLYMLYMHIS